MTTIAQEAFAAFQASQLEPTYNWEGMTTEQKAAEMDTYTALKIAASKEVEANRIEAELQAQAEAEQRKQEKITYLQGKGYTCDNSEADWDKLYNHTELYGSNWKAQSDYQRSVSTGIDYFVAIALSLGE